MFASTSYNATVALPSGQSVLNTSSSPNCTSTMPLACCTSPASTVFRGYTAFVTTGALGGRTQANLRCAAEFPGSHLCTRTEYHSSRPAQAPPTPGAYLDNAVTGSFSPDTFGPCASFMFASTSYNATVALPSGQSVLNTSSAPNCTTSMPLACCD